MFSNFLHNVRASVIPVAHHFEQTVYKFLIVLNPFLDPSRLTALLYCTNPSSHWTNHFTQGGCEPSVPHAAPAVTFKSMSGRSSKRLKGANGRVVPRKGVEPAVRGLQKGNDKSAVVKSADMPHRKRPLPKEVYEEIWTDVFFAGTEWSQLKEVEEFDWDFDHLDDALNEGGDLEGKQVHLFGVTEPQLVQMSAEDVKGTVVPVPAIVAVECERPPPSLVGIKSVQRAEEEIIPMRSLKMSWHPYVPEKLIGSRRFKPRVHVLKCEQRRARLVNMTEAAVHKYDYVLPYLIRPDQEDELTLETDVQVLVDIEGRKAPLMMQYDFELDDIDEFVEEQIKENELVKEKHDEVIRGAIKEAVRNTKLKFKEEKAARQKRIDDIPQEVKDAIKKMRVYKFYPQNEMPDLSSVKSKFVNRYYGQANELR